MVHSFSENPQGLTYFAVGCVFQGIAILAIAARLWSRRIIRLSLQLNDYAILAALVLSAANLGVLGGSVAVGMGMHFEDLSSEDLVAFSKLQVAISAIWAWALYAIKVSILDMYIKIFRVPWFITFSYVFLGVQTAWGLANFLAIMLLCRPLAYQWDKTIEGGQCGNFEASYYGAHIIILVLDIVLTLMPIPVLWNLKMALRKKVGVALMFAIGLTINIFNVIRIAWREKVSSTDITYDYALLFFFSVLEAQLGILLACVPSMQPVLRELAVGARITTAARTIFSDRKSSRGASKDSHSPNISKDSGGHRLQRLHSFDTDTDVLVHGGETRGYRNEGSNQGSNNAAGAIRVTSTWDVENN